ncbi:beta-ketoacyl-[acyl-carrier-protein] synthase family protein [Streptomyces cyaneofuscatus]|uniref:beta-ketoacyl-[acyl-carrier-protein] synthase family protein n=1 Tax=Streptomyces cyaneofuscatus TaxID=66883 RepID=UPI0033A6FF5E
MARRVVITGVGVLAPGGLGVRDFWSLLSQGRTATRRITRFDPSPFRSQVAAEIDFVPAAHGLDPQESERMGRAAQFGVVAAREALADSGVAQTLAPQRTGVVMGTAGGAVAGLDAAYRSMSDERRLADVDPAHAPPWLYDHFVPSSFATEVAWAVGAEGPSAVIANGCTAGIDAVAHAVELIRENRADVMVAGATDAPITPVVMAAFDAVRATTTHNDEPTTASRPFDDSRDGFVLGEGAAVFVLEELHHARSRGAHVYAEVAGHASRSNAFHMTGLHPEGRELAEAVRAALDEARLDPRDLDYVNAHGSGTKLNDRHETQAYKLALGEHAHRVPVSSVKSMIGHAMGSVGAIEIAASVLAMEHHVVPPTANLHVPGPGCDLDYVPRVAREQRTDAVLTVGSGFGGFQSAMVLTRHDRSAP